MMLVYRHCLLDSPTDNNTWLNGDY